MDEFKFVRSKAGQSFVRIVGAERDILLDVSQIGRVLGSPGRTAIALTTGGIETAEIEPGKFIDGLLEFLEQ